MSWEVEVYKRRPARVRVLGGSREFWSGENVHRILVYHLVGYPQCSLDEDGLHDAKLHDFAQLMHVNARD